MFICELASVRKYGLYCSVTEGPCAFQRYCDIKLKWLQTDGAKRCKVRKEHGERNNEADS